MTDQEIRETLALRDLREAYLAELADLLGHTEGWTEECFTAIDTAPIEIRRQAALNVIAADVAAKGES